MKPSLKPMLATTLLAFACLSVQAEPGNVPVPGDGPSAARCHPTGPRHEHVKAHAERRANTLKTQLKLTPEQEGAWAAYIAAMKPPVGLQRPDRTQIADLATPERLDMIRQMRLQRDAWFTQREAATRSFYAGLNEVQKKVFDQGTRRHAHHGAHERGQR